jgi:hypothetical protein
MLPVRVRAEVRRVDGLQHATERPRIVAAGEPACPRHETGARVRNEGAADHRRGAAAAGIVVEGSTLKRALRRHGTSPGDVSRRHLHLIPRRRLAFASGAWGLTFMRSRARCVISRLGGSHVCDDAGAFLAWTRHGAARRPDPGTRRGVHVASLSFLEALLRRLELFSCLRRAARPVWATSLILGIAAQSYHASLCHVPPDCLHRGGEFRLR